MSAPWRHREKWSALATGELGMCPLPQTCTPQGRVVGYEIIGFAAPDRQRTEVTGYQHCQSGAANAGSRPEPSYAPGQSSPPSGHVCRDSEGVKWRQVWHRSEMSILKRSDFL